MQGKIEEEPNRKKEMVVRGQRRKGGTTQGEGRGGKGGIWL